MTPDRLILQRVFLRLLERMGAAMDEAQAHWEELVAAYSGEGRHYHNLEHLSAMFTLLHPLEKAFADWDVVLMSMFYHDVVYDALAADNEERSAAVAVRVARSAGLETARLRRLAWMVLATKRHESSEDADTNLFLDADLAVLGSDPETYARYAAAVREEYAVYPDEVYRSGRQKVLRELLQMPAVYKTDTFRERYEAVARRNVTAEITALAGGA